MTTPFVKNILDMLNDLFDVRSRPMFGGHGIYHDGMMIGLIANGVFYLKVDDEKHMSVSVVLRFVVPFKSFWLHEAACVKLMVNEADDGIATLWARKAAIIFEHPNCVFNGGPQLRVLEVSIPF